MMHLSLVFPKRTLLAQTAFLLSNLPILIPMRGQNGIKMFKPFRRIFFYGYGSHDQGSCFRTRKHSRDASRGWTAIDMRTDGGVTGYH
jgi:hypothetical protein